MPEEVIAKMKRAVEAKNQKLLQDVDGHRHGFLYGLQHEFDTAQEIPLSHECSFNENDGRLYEIKRELSEIDPWVNRSA